MIITNRVSSESASTTLERGSVLSAMEDRAKNDCGWVDVRRACRNEGKRLRLSEQAYSKRWRFSMVRSSDLRHGKSRQRISRTKYDNCWSGPMAIQHRRMFVFREHRVPQDTNLEISRLLARPVDSVSLITSLKELWGHRGSVDKKWVPRLISRSTRGRVPVQVLSTRTRSFASKAIDKYNELVNESRWM